MSFHFLVTHRPLERAAGDQKVESRSAYDIGRGLSMQPHVSTTRNNLAKLVSTLRSPTALSEGLRVINMCNSFGYDIGPGLSMQLHVSTMRNNLTT